MSLLSLIRNDALQSLHDIASVLLTTVDDVRQMFASIVQADHGKEGLEQLKVIGKLAVFLMDWNIPELNGLD